MYHPSLIVMSRANWEALTLTTIWNWYCNEMAAKRSGVLYFKTSKLEEFSKEKMAKEDSGCVKARQVVR